MTTEEYSNARMVLVLWAEDGHDFFRVVNMEQAEAYFVDHESGLPVLHIPHGNPEVSDGCMIQTFDIGDVSYYSSTVAPENAEDVMEYLVSGENLELI